MKIYYPKDKNGNEIAFRTPENFVYDTTGESLSTKLENLSSSIGNIKGSVSDDVTALDKKFTEAIENRATNSDLEIERRRIDNIANLSSGSTTGDAELIDIRTMTDGTIAANAGTAVRTQIKNLITSESNKTGTTKMTYKLGTEQAVPDIIEYSNLINALSEEVYSETLSNSGKGYLVDENKNVRVNDIVSVKCDADKQDGLTIVIKYNDGTVDKHITTLNNMLVTSEMKTIEVNTTKTATFIVKRINSNEKNGLILSAIENMRKELYINLLNDMRLTTGDIGTGGNYVDNDNSYRSTGYSDLSYEIKTEIDHDLPVFLLFTSDYNITIKVFYYEKHTRTLNQSMTKTYTYTSGSRTQIKLLPNYYNKFVFTFNDSNVPSIFDFTKASFLSYEYERFDIQNYIPLTTGKGGWEWKNINTAIAPYVEPRLANITNRLPLIVNQVDELKGDLINNYTDISNEMGDYQFGVILSDGIIYNENYVRTSTPLKVSKLTKLYIYGKLPRIGLFDNEDLSGAPISVIPNIPTDTLYEFVASPDYYYCFSFSRLDTTINNNNGKVYKSLEYTTNNEFNDILINNMIEIPMRYVQGAILRDGTFNNATTLFKRTAFLTFEKDFTIKVNIKDGFNFRCGVYKNPTTSSFEKMINVDKFKVESGKWYIFCFGGGSAIKPETDSGTINKILYSSTSVKLKGKTVYNFGDSLMYGHYEKGMLDDLCADNEMVLNKYAINGATILGSTGLYNIENQVLNASETVPDFVIFDGLMNDDSITTSYTTNLGTLSDSFIVTDLDTNTFYGAMEHLIYTIRNKYVTSNIIFVCCHKTPSRDKTAQDTLQEAVRKCCEKWSIPYVDVYNHGQINCYMESMRTTWSYNNQGETSGGNGTHLTGAGYNKWYAPLIKAKMLELLS